MLSRSLWLCGLVAACLLLGLALMGQERTQGQPPHELPARGIAPEVGPPSAVNTPPVVSTPEEPARARVDRAAAPAAPGMDLAAAGPAATDSPKRATLTLIATPEGDVTAAELAALEGVALTIWDRRPEGQSRTAVFDGKGRAVFEDVSRGSWSRNHGQDHVALTPELRVRNTFGVLVPDSGSIEAELPIERAHTLRCTVQDEDGKPLRFGAAIVGERVETRDRRGQESEFHRVPMDREGTFVVHGLPADIDRVQIICPPELLPLELHGPDARALLARPQPCTLTLRTAERIDVLLRLPDGTPAAGIGVRVEPVDGTKHPQKRLTKADGRAYFPGLRLAEYEVIGVGFASRGQTDRTLWTVPANTRLAARRDERTVEITLVAAPRVWGRVTGLGAGAEARVQIGVVDGRSLPFSSSGSQLRPPVDPAAHTFDTALPPGRYAASLHGGQGRHTSHWVEFDVVGSDVQVTLEATAPEVAEDRIKDTGALLVTVLDETGAAHMNGSVRAVNLKLSPGEYLDPRRAAPSPRTDKSGQARLEPLPAGEVEFVVTVRSTAPRDRSWQRGAGYTTFHRRATIYGDADTDVTVVIDRTPPATASGRLIDKVTGDSLTAERITLQTESGEIASTWTDLDGHFTLPSHVTGPVSIQCETGQRSAPITLESGHQELGDVPIDLTKPAAPR